MQGLTYIKILYFYMRDWIIFLSLYYYLVLFLMAKNQNKLKFIHEYTESEKLSFCQYCKYSKIFKNIVSGIQKNDGHRDIIWVCLFSNSILMACLF